ncbi:hypothetical protein [Janthinobacterium lividum]|uniref:hypothetical protein n=1 Tax=Janthinobacterium lividum TaxID=29581 RepID=UPI000AFF5AB6|nr:hypothetical protein [Janthinobacterium lividum]
MNFAKISDQLAFYVCVLGGTTGAIATILDKPLVAGVGCAVAAVAPIVNRIVSGRIQLQLGPRSLTKRQRKILIEKLRTGLPFKLWVAVNRDEAEPSEYHRQIDEALTEASLQTQYYGAMAKSAKGVAISGQPSPEKALLMAAFSAAKIPFVDVVFRDAQNPEQGFGGVGVWIGVHPGLGS